MRRDTQHVILGLLGGALIKLAIGGGFLAYVRPAHQPWLLAAGAVMVVLAVVGLILDMRPAADPFPEVDHDHGGGHAPWLMVLPVLAILLVPPAALGADAVDRSLGNSVTEAAPRFAPLPPGDAPELTMTDFVARAISERAGSLAGREVTLTGFVVRHDEQVRLARLAISCCAADARPMTVRLVGSGPDSGLDYPPDTWLQVRGRLQPGSATAETRYVPALTVSSAEVVPAPEDPYEV